MARQSLQPRAGASDLRAGLREAVFCLFTRNNSQCLQHYLVSGVAHTLLFCLAVRLRVFSSCCRVAPERLQVCPSPQMGYLGSG
jgi:hypothetical protein